MNVSLEMIKAVEQAKQLRFTAAFAKVKQMFDFQDEEGRPVSGCKIEMGSSVVTIMGDAAEMAKVRPYEGKYVAIEGHLETELKKTGVKVSWFLDKVTEIKG